MEILLGRLGTDFSESLVIIIPSKVGCKNVQRQLLCIFCVTAGDKKNSGKMRPQWHINDAYTFIVNPISRKFNSIQNAIII